MEERADGPMDATEDRTHFVLFPFPMLWWSLLLLLYLQVVAALLSLKGEKEDWSFGLASWMTGGFGRCWEGLKSFASFQVEQAVIYLRLRVG